MSDKTKKELLQEILAKNPKTEAKFTNYYKYCFGFICEGVDFGVGGDSGDIYRLDIYPEMLLSDLIEYIED